ncbi:MAG: thermonuclease family protein [Deltaproteobacteria bacterium]|nr:thermonuclease family protein [Deltaproteobacteria bacterium]
MKALCWAGAFVLLLVPTLAFSLEARVQRVVDGRTIVLTNGERVRYIGVEIPDDVQSATEAANVNSNLVEGADVRLEFDKELRDKDGNLLAYVYVGDLMVNEYLIQSGYARVESYSPNRRFLTRMLRVQAKASRERLGI